jgi:hypothetical protein
VTDACTRPSFRGAVRRTDHEIRFGEADVHRRGGQFVVDERVAHDTYGVGRVIGTDLAVVTVDFGTQTVRIISPFDKLEKL